MSDQRAPRSMVFVFFAYTLSIALLGSLFTLALQRYLYGPPGKAVEVLTYNDLEKKLAGLPESSQRMVAICKYMLPAVVNVTSVKPVQSPGFRGRNPFERYLNPPQYAQSSGSGFVVSEDGYILTNHHVVGEAGELYVTFFNRTTVTARLIGSDPHTDLALLKVADKGDLARLKKQKIFQVAQLGTAQDLQPGEWVIAVGNPFTLDHSVSFGVVSATGRSNVGIADYENFIQTDAAINPGNSGGPLVSVKTGKVIGVNTAILSKSGGFQGIGFAIPVEVAKTVMEQLKKQGTVERGYLGVSTQDLTGEIAEHLGLETQDGALVVRVYPGSPAEKAGLRRGDVIVSVNGQKVAGSRSLRSLAALAPIGKKAAVKILRRGREMSLDVLILDRKSLLEKTFAGKRRLGLLLTELSPEVGRRFGYSGQRGLLVEKVAPSSLAARAGLRPGQLILSVNRKKVNTLAEFEEAIQPLFQGKSLLIIGMEGEFAFYTTLRP